MPQAPELSLPAPAPAVYTTELALTESLLRKGTPEPGEGLYPRDGTAEVTDIEQALSVVTIPDQRLNVVVSSGMAAVTGAVRFALAYEGRRRDETPTLAHAREAYTQSKRYLDDERYRGISTKGFDSGDPEAIDRLLGSPTPPAVIFAETVTNTPEMPVLDVHHLLAAMREHQAAGREVPIAVLDNTLPLSTGLDFGELLEPDDKVLVVESATKGAMHNSEHLGVVYGSNKGLMDGFRRHKVTDGIVTSTLADIAILRALEATTPGFHERNRALYESTAKLAVALAAAQETLGDRTDFFTTFPGVADHPNYDYAVQHLPNGISPVVFMGAGLHEDSPRALLRRIAEHPRMREQIQEGQVFLGQSFGFSEGRLLYSQDASYVRVAGGYDIDSDALGDALREAAADV